MSEAPALMELQASAPLPRVAARPKPRLRGVSHQIAAFVALVAGVVLVSRALGTRAAAASAVYAFALTAMFTISAAYHRPTWAPAARARMRRLDHSTIFVLIAGSATPFCVLGLEPRTATRLLVLMWLGAAAGILKAVFWSHAPRWLNAALYVSLGFALIPQLGALGQGLGSLATSLVLAGGVIYALGAVVYALRWPDPSPAVFGYHEVFHAMVITASACHFAAVLMVVSRAR